jgi:predicted ATP-dependent Lon-type protease
MIEIDDGYYDTVAGAEAEEYGESLRRKKLFEVLHLLAVALEAETDVNNENFFNLGIKKKQGLAALSEYKKLMKDTGGY